MNMASWKFRDLPEESNQCGRFSYMLPEDSHSNIGSVMILLHLRKRLKILFQYNKETKYMEENS